MKKQNIKFIDLFAGIGGIRKGFEDACNKLGFSSTCVFTSEIKPHAVEILKQNHPDEEIYGDITQIDEKQLPNFDFLLAGFPCQAFSSAGKRLGFQDTRGTLFFDVERILKEKQPFGFVLENVEGLVNHDKEKSSDPIGRTLYTILEHLNMLGYKVSWKVLNAKMFGVPQERKRIYIVGTKKIDLTYRIFIMKRLCLVIFLKKDLWLKKVWEITRRMETWPLNLQIKADVVHKIRPGVWYSTSRQRFKMFTCLEHFISAMEETVYQNPKTHSTAGTWKKDFLYNYQSFYNKTLDIPRWQDIAEDYLY